MSLPCLQSQSCNRRWARNIGIHAASGELVAHLDDDDLYAPGQKVLRNHLTWQLPFPQLCHVLHRVRGYLAFMATRRKKRELTKTTHIQKGVLLWGGGTSVAQDEPLRGRCRSEALKLVCWECRGPCSYTGARILGELAVVGRCLWIL